MDPFYENNGLRIYHGDSREVLPQLDETFESCITDPPYEIGFMGKPWDKRGISFDPKTWMTILAALKPGATLLAFGGTRTWHRLTCAVEDAGFEIRDMLLYLHAEGFPKAHDISKALDRAAKVERKEVGFNGDCAHDGYNRKTDGSHAKPHEKQGGHGYKKSYWQTPITAPATDSAKTWKGWSSSLKPAWDPILVAMKPLDGTFAENALKHGVAGLNIDGTRLGPRDRKDYGLKKSNRSHKAVFGKFSENADFDASKGRWPANVILDEGAAELLDLHNGDHPSRFFYTARAIGKERGNVKYAALPLFGVGESEDRNDHPTVKPLDLMRYLCVLTQTPSGGTILDPFMGSGTTLLAARLAGRPCIGIEKEKEHCEIAVKRLEQPL